MNTTDITGLSPGTVAWAHAVYQDLASLLLPTVVTAAGPYTPSVGGIYVMAPTVPASLSVVLPAAGNGVYTFIDGSGIWNQFPVTFSVSGGTVKINAANALPPFNGQYAAISFLFANGQYYII